MNYAAAEILEHYNETDGAAWERIGSKLFADGEIFDLWHLEIDVEFDRDEYRLVAVEKYVYDTDRPEEIDHTETVFLQAWKL